MIKVVEENIRKLVAIRNYTQQDIADKSGISRQTINLIISSKSESNPEMYTLIKIAEVLDIEFSQLFIRGIEDYKCFDKKIDLQEYMNIFVQNIKIKLHGKKRNILSGDPGIQPSTISELLNGNSNNPEFSTVYAISEQLNIKLEVLFRRGGK